LQDAGVDFVMGRERGLSGATTSWRSRERPDC